MVSKSRDAAVVITPVELITNAEPVLPVLITQFEGTSPVAETVITVVPVAEPSLMEAD